MSSMTNKRELQFAVESWQEIGESQSRLRPRNRVVESYADKGDHDEDDRVSGSGSRRPKTVNNGVSSKLKELLQTGLLECLDIWYIRGVKVISPTKFEIHARIANKRPADYIYLDNQNSLRDVLNACKHATLNGHETVIRTAISSTPAPSQSQTSISLTLQAADCVLMRPSDIGKPPYVACVKKIEADSRNNVEVRVRWYYRPKKSLGGRRQFHGAKELFLSDHLDIQSAHTIEGKCNVHSFKNYTKLENVGIDDYFCRFEYMAATGAFTPDRVAV